MKSTHILDLTRAKIPKGMYPAGVTKLLPIVQGSYKCEWDLVRDEMDTEEYTKLVVMLKAQQPEAKEEIPIGFNTCSLPTGAIIRECANE